MDNTEVIEVLTRGRVAWLDEQFRLNAWPKSAGYFARCFEAQERGELVVWVCRTEERLHGYVLLVSRSDYAPFRDAHVPEIRDLNVVPRSRRHGVASRLLDEAERRASEWSPVVGIGVGLHPGYGAAQRMYVKRGYVPDARPLTYRNENVTEGQPVRLDDELVLHLTKELQRAHDARS